MGIQVLGISGSPVPDSNTDRAVQRILSLTGLSTQFVKLSDLEVAPCRACLGCVETNECVVDDDGQRLAELFHEAPAFVLGGFTPYSSLDARTKAFMERMYCHRHRSRRKRPQVWRGGDYHGLPAWGSRNAACCRDSDLADRLLDDGGGHDELGDDGDSGQRPLHPLRLWRRLFVQRHQNGLRSRGFCGIGWSKDL